MSAAAADGRHDLPIGFEVRLRDDVVRLADGNVLIGGSPVRAIRLRSQSRGLLVEGRVRVDSPAAGVLARALLDGNLADPTLEGVKVSPVDVTVVVPVRDRPQQLERCLSALVPLQVIVIDDASDDFAAVADVARRYGARVLSLRTNVGPAGARNSGLARVRTPLVGFVDSDVEVEGSALLDLARHCLDPRVALVGPKVKGFVRRERPRWFERYDAAASSLDLGGVGGQVKPGAAVGWLPSACLVGRVDLLGSAFDPDLRVAEDVDLVWRLVDSGHVVRYDPSVVARHDVRGSIRGWLGRKFLYGTGGADLAARHQAQVAPAVLSVTTAVGAAALLQRRWWSLPIAGAALASTTRSLGPCLPVAEGRTALAAGLATRGLGWAVRQEASLMLRHWWPLGIAAVCLGRTGRRTAATAVAIDLGIFMREHPDLDVLTALAGRRLDDLAYGAGLWWGVVRRRDPRCLAVRRLRPRSPKQRKKL